MSNFLKEYADGLRELADFAESHPDLFEQHCFGEHINLFAYSSEGMATMTRQLGKSQKKVSGSYYCMVREFGPHTIELNISRDQFCERKQTGTTTVTKPDPEALKQVPTVEVEEPVYEWICPESVLGAATKPTEV